MEMNTPNTGSAMRRYKSLDDYRRINETLNRLLEKERIEREKIDTAALKYLKKVKDDYEAKMINLNEELETLRNKTSGCVTKEELRSVKFDLRMAEKEVESMKGRLQFLRDERKKAKEELEKVEEIVKEKDKEIETWKTNYEALSSKVETVEKERDEFSNKIKALEEENSKLCKMNERLTKANENLKLACSSVESQVAQFESLYNSQVGIKAKLTEEKKQTLEKVKKLETELVSIETKYKDQIMDMSQTIGSLENQVADFKEKCEKLVTELDQTKSLLEEEKQFHRLHEDELPMLVNENQMKRETIENLHKELEKHKVEMVELKEERASHITEISNLWNKNKQLTQGLEEALFKNDTLQKRIDVIVTEMEEERSKFELEKLRLNENINQQLKLIDLLQDRMDKPKKSSWFGHSNSPGKEPGPAVRMMQIREIEAALEREKTKNRMLAKQIDETKNELRRCKNEIRKYEKRGFSLPKTEDLGDSSGDTQSSGCKYSRDREIEVEMAPSIRTVPSAPLSHEIDSTCSSGSSATTDNNDTSEEEKEFTFTDSILADLGEKKVSNLDDVAAQMAK